MTQKSSPGSVPAHFISIRPDAMQSMDGELVEEALACISVNGQELATFMCTPHQLDQLAIGFLYNERLINSLDDLLDVHVSTGRTCVDVWIKDFTQPERKIITAGCGGGVTFDDLTGEHPALTSGLQATPEALADLMRQMLSKAELYQRARGIHTAALADGENLLLQVEDVGRHNCLDRLSGAALMQNIPTRDRILLSSGRISSEMINKARRLATPIVCSRTSPTSLSVALAQTWNMTIVAYLRQSRMRIYTHPQRVLDRVSQMSVSEGKPTGRFDHVDD